MKDVLNDTSIEAVAVATPTITHFEIAKKVLEAGKHLFLEKPGCSNSRQLEQLCEKSEKIKLVFAVGYEFAHHPVLKKIKELVEIENVKEIIFEWNKWSTFKSPIISHLLSHEISIIKSLGINSLSPKNYQKRKVISEADIIKLEFKSDKDIKITSCINRISPNKNKTVTVVGGKESYVWNNNNLYKIDIKKQILLPIHIDTRTAVSLEIEDFFISIRENKKPLTSGRFALDIWETLNKIGN